MTKIKSKHRNDIETRYLKSGLTVRVVVDDFENTESPLNHGEIYGWIVEDEDGETLESCWGYIGESDYALQEGLDTAEGIEKRRNRSRLDKLKAMIRNRVPLMKRPAILESVVYG